MFDVNHIHLPSDPSEMSLYQITGFALLALCMLISFTSHGIQLDEAVREKTKYIQRFSCDVTHTLPNNTAPMYIPDWLAMVAGSWWVKTLLDQRKKSPTDRFGCN